MIVMGVYPYCFEDESSLPLESLLLVTNALVPNDIAFHLLPFFPNSGDSGFAPDDWFSVDEKLGTWDQVSSLARSRKLIVDGIYNHVGFNHEFVMKFFTDPEKYQSYVYAFKNKAIETAPRSPRGGSMLKEYTIQNLTWRIWQTFSEAAVDINLDNREVFSYVERQLNLFRNIGVWGIRLDGPSYYGKDLDGTSPRYNPKSYIIARRIADMAIERGIHVTAQLDCDEQGCKYFPDNLGYQVPMVDYSYSAVLLYSLLYKDVRELIAHLKSTWHLPVIRAPRTHDGVLLRSKNLSPHVLDGLIDFAKGYAVKLRIIDGRPYEINNSLPYLFSLEDSNSSMMRSKIELAITFTAMLPGWTYIYLPALLGYIPELYYAFEDDPRLLNRKAITRDYLMSQTIKEEKHIYELLVSLDQIKKSFPIQEPASEHAITSPETGVVIVKRNKGQITFVANFSTEHSVRVPVSISGEVMLASGLDGKELLPLGFGVFQV